MLHPLDYFDLSQSAHAALFDGCAHVWDALPRIGPYVESLLASDYTPNAHTLDLHPTVVIEGDVYIGPGTQVAPHTYIQGPTVIGTGCQVRQGAFVRMNTLLADGAVAGHATETKNAALLENAHAPHFSYVGDSILGRRVNLGAGTKLSNFPMNADLDPATGTRPTVMMPYNGERIDTGVVKFGAILGDGVQCGCNCVTNPGTMVGPRTLIYTLTMLKKGIYPADSIIKLRQTQEIVERL
ncbi:MAG: glucose-1-phosphate thymidylyltransferase [Chloroflexota bacterium]